MPRKTTAAVPAYVCSHHDLAKTKDGTWQPEAVTDVRRAAWARWRRGGSCGHGKFLELLDATEPGVWAQNWPSSSAATLLRVSKTANEFFRQHRFPMALCCNQAWRGRQLLIMNPAKRLELLANVKILCAKHKVTHLTMDKCCLGAPTTQERLQSHRGGTSLHSLADVAALLLVLRVCPDLQHLSLYGNVDLGEAWTVALSDALVDCRELQVLCLGSIGGGDRFLPLLAAKLPSMQKLESLALCGNRLMDSEYVAKCFARALPSCTALTSLDLDDCRIDESDAVAVRAAWNRGQPDADGLHISLGMGRR